MKFAFLQKFLSVSISISMLFCFFQNAFSQTSTNIPLNLFLTDNGFLFWNKSGQRLIDVKKIKDAEQSPESWPAEKDPKGHWGQSTNGFQLSLRFDKQVFTNGEPIIAVMLMRNITNTPLTYFRPTYVLATKDGNFLKKTSDNNLNLKQITMWPEVTIYPQTQQKYYENLSRDYDLTTNGEYIFQAVCNHPSVSSQEVSISIK